MKNKVYPYTLERVSEKTVHFVSKDARIDQEFLKEDVSELILDLPNLIIAEQEYVRKRSDVIRFRVVARTEYASKRKRSRKDMIQCLGMFVIWLSNRRFRKILVHTLRTKYL